MILNLKELKLLNDDGSVRLDYDRLPEEMKRLPNWVGWKSLQLQQLNPKAPLMIGRSAYAKPDVSATWTDFDSALKHVGMTVTGLGFVCSPDTGIVVGDIDHCVNPETGEIDSDAWDEIVRLNTYTELSPSGTGLRWVALGVKPGCDCKHGNYEIYSPCSSVTEPGPVFKRTKQGEKIKTKGDGYEYERNPDGSIKYAPQPEGNHYLRMTGAVLPGYEHVRECSDVIADLYNRRLLKDTAPAPMSNDLTVIKQDTTVSTTPNVPNSSTYVPPDPISVKLTRQQISEKLHRMTIDKSKRFKALWSGTDGGMDESDADFEFCGFIAYYTDDIGIIQDMFLDSPRWKNDPARQAKHSPDYPLITAENALKQRKTHWTPKSDKTVNKPVQNPQEKTEEHNGRWKNVETTVPPSTVSVKTSSGDTLKLYMGPWEMSPAGVRKVTSVNPKTGEVGYSIASTVPVWVETKLKNMQTGEVSLVISWDTTIYSDADREHPERIEFTPSGSVTCLSSIATSAKAQTLSDAGLPVMDTQRTKAFNAYIMDLVNYNLHTIPTRASTSQLGWYELNGNPWNFAPFDAVDWFETGDSKHTYDALGKYTDNGDVAPWRDFMRTFREDKDLRFIMSASLASPLLSLIGDLPFMVHVHGLTNCGKSIALKIASAIWAPYIDYLKTMSGTAKAILQYPVTLNSLPAIIDEFQIIANDKNYNPNQLVMALCEGHERERLNRDGSSRPSRSYKSVIITAGEQPLLDMTAGGGALSRVLSVHINNRNMFTGKQAREVTEFIEHHYGTVGRAWVKGLKNLTSPETLSALKTQYAELREEIYSKLDTSGKQAGATAIILLADNIASTMIFKDPENMLTVDDLRPYITTMNEIDPATRSKDFVRSWVASHQTQFLDKGDSLDNIHGELLGKFDGDNVYVIKDKLATAMRERTFSLDAVLPAWVADGFALTIGKKKPRPDNCQNINGIKVRCLHLDLGTLPDFNGDEEPEDDAIITKVTQ